jgi:hypothetical protein
MRFIDLFRVSKLFVIGPLVSASSNYAFSQLVTASAGTASLDTCVNSFNKSKYAYKKVRAYHKPWGHKINAQWHTDAEAWYMYVRDVPNVAGNVNPLPTEVGANGASCSAGEKTYFAPEFGVRNYFEHEISPRRYLSIRNESPDDIKDQRTGYATTRYSERMIGYGYWIGSTVLVRPELHFEHSYDLATYDLDTKHTQLIAAGDLAYHF